MIPAFPSYLLTHINRSFFAILVIIYAFFVGSGAAHAAQASLAWNANPQPEVAGYMVHYGQVSGAYTNKVDVGKVTAYTIAGLLDGRTYYYAVTAYDAGRAESPFSNEASASTPFAAPVAAFSADKTSGAAPATIVFTSSSTGTISSYSWSFGDGTSSTAQNPTHTYSVVGTYSVSLTTTGPGGSDSETKASYISVSSTPPPPTAPTANFTPSATSGVAPLTVTFTNSSTGSISTYSWNFGDGTTSTVASPSHVYSNAGTYTVSLTVTGSGGSNTMTKSNLLTVSSTPPPAAKPNEVIVDNLGPGIQDATRTMVGLWCNSVGTGSYGTQSLYNCGTSKDRYRWSFSTPTTGDYSVYVRWSTAPNRSAGVPITVSANSGLVTKNFNQKLNGGTWVLHGTYSFTAGVTKYVEISAAKGIANADAVRIVAAGTPAASVDPTLVAAFNFDEGTGTKLTDRSSKANNGVISGATWASVGRYGKALSFNGVNNWVTINDAASLDLTNNVTISAWVYPTAVQTGWTTVIVKEQPGSTPYYLYANSTTNFPAGGIIAGGFERTVLGKSTLPINTWTHIATSYDGATQKFYMNGVLISSRAQTGAIATSTGALRIGGNGVWGEYFKGMIDNVRVYNRALTNSDIQIDLLAPVLN